MSYGSGFVVLIQVAEDEILLMASKHVKPYFV